MVNVAMAGVGACENKHLDGLASIPGADVVAVVDPVEVAARKAAEARGLGRVATSLDPVLADDGVDAVILATPTPVHAEQAVACPTAVAVATLSL